MRAILPPLMTRIASSRAAPAVALAALLLVALLLRLGVVAAIPHFFGSGDPSVYYASAKGCLAHGVPRIEFVWHFLTAPPQVAHVEDYCEPGFAYLLAIPTGLFGGGVRGAMMLSVICGTLTVWCVFRYARRFGVPCALLAAALVALEPWSIYYGGLIMKEAAVALVVVLFMAAARRQLAAAQPSPRAAAAL
ncbi:MAG TPA: glycosyltransferase family 39 protein, partial [Candidatus Eisenbacteria bacterium]|nr:glycosyltransferase family 39 protein [Candidatus Eisenbacteria bacterium]